MLGQIRAATFLATKVIRAGERVPTDPQPTQRRKALDAEIPTEPVVATGSRPANGSSSKPEPEAVHAAVVAALRTVFDPEIPVNIYDLGLVYKIDIINRCHVEVDMTLTGRVVLWPAR